MGTHLGINNFDEMFSSISSVPIIVNDLLDTLESEKNEFDKQLFVTYTDTDLLETMPECYCGKTFGQQHIFPDGTSSICKHCNEPVTPKLDKPLEPIIWVQAPIGVEGLINPQVWRLLSDFFSLSNNSNQRFNIIKYLTITDYRPDRKHHARWMDAIEALGIKRGLNYFIRNFDEIISKLITIPQFSATKDKKEKLAAVLEFIEMYRDNFFSQHLPIHNKTIMVIENTKFGTYMDSTLKTIIDAVRNISGIDSEIKGYSVAQKENRAAKLTESLVEFDINYEKSFIAGKPGLARKHVYASRCFWSFRAVINSLTEPHHHDEIHLSWAVAVTTFRIHLLGKLYRRGYGHNDASYFLNAHTHVWHPLLRELFDELINESPYELSHDVEESIWPENYNGVIKARRGIPCIFGRNPSMYRTSIQRMFITKIKDDPKIFSISYPITSVAGPNADFDGDAMFAFLTLDNWTTDELRYLAPHFGAWKLSGPRTIGDNMPLPKPIVTSVIGYLYNRREEKNKRDPEKFRLMQSSFNIRTLH